MNAIVSVDLNWAIGYKNDLLFHVPDDMRYFKKMTVGKVVVMGENTFYSLPKQLPLTDRINIVLSDNKHLQIDGVTICNSLDELIKNIQEYNPEDVFIIGGQMVYKLMLKYCNKVYVTQFYEKAKADKYFTYLPKSKNWERISRSEPHEYNGLKFTFDRYERKSK